MKMNFDKKKYTSIGLSILLITGALTFLYNEQPAYAVSVAYNDGSVSSSISTNCAARTTVATLATSFGAAAVGDPNIVIATVDWVSSDAGVESVVQGATSNGLYNGVTQMVGTQYTFYVGTSGQGEHYTYLLEDAIALANPTYTVETCVSATASTAEAKILAFKGLESSFIDNGNVATSAGSFVTIATLTTDLTANNHIIIASIQIDCDGASTIAAGNIELRNSADTMLAENEFHMICSSAAAGDGFSIVLIATNPSGAANTSYKVAVQETTSGLAGAEAKILAFKAANDEYYFTDSGSTGVTTSTTQLNSRATSFYNSEQIGILDATQYDDTDTQVESLVVTTGHTINNVADIAVNDLAISGQGAASAAGEGLRHSLVYGGTLSAANPTFLSTADASATGLNGESKILAFSLIDGVSDPNFSGMQQNNMWIFAIGRMYFA